jgi:putative membrane protein
MFKRTLLFCAVILTSSAGLALADGNLPSEQDKHFVAAATSAGMLEVQLGHYAVQNASSDDVKRFGQHMVDDHTQANTELNIIAARLRMDAPKDLNKHDQNVLDRIEKTSGPEFDKEYVAQMVKDHEDAVDLFTEEANDGNNTEIKGFAQQTLPMLQNHLQMAKDLDKKV